MASFNRVILIGNLTRDVELRNTQTGMAVTDLGLAINDRVKRNDAWVEETTFVDVTLWGRTAEVAAEYLSKGAPVLIEGKLRTEEWQKDGQRRTKLKVVGESMQMLGSRQEKQEPVQQPVKGPTQHQTRRANEVARERGDDNYF